MRDRLATERFRLPVETVLAPAMAAVLLWSIWEGIVRFYQLPKLILPRPWDVFESAWNELVVPRPWAIWEAGWIERNRCLMAIGVTTLEVVTAYAVSLLFAVTLAVVFGQSRWLRAAVYPYAIFLKTLPIIAIAPLIVLWVGQGFWGVVVVAGIVSFLPILTNTTEGMLAVPSSFQDLMTLYRANRWQRLFKLQLPNSLPFLVAGCKIASVGCVLGAVVGEIFVGFVKHPGIGYVIYSKRDSDVAGMFVYIALSGMLGIALFAATSFVGDRLLLFWRDPTVDGRK